MGLLFLDQYSLLHFATGVVFYFLNISLTWSLLGHTAFELLENTNVGISLINRFPFWPGGKPYADAPINMFGDSVAFTLGWLVAQALDWMGAKYEPHLA